MARKLDPRVNLKFKRLKKLFESLDDNVLKTVESLMENAAFMSVQLEDLQDEILQQGSLVEEYQNGANQYGKKESTEIKVYNQVIKNYSSVIKLLVSYLPSGTSDDLGEFSKFMKKR